VRLFVAVEVPDEVRDAVAALERPEGDDVRWSEPGSWHVTLRFLGEVDDGEAPVAALGRVVAAATTASVGPTPERLGPTAVVLAVEGLDEVAAAVAVAFAGLAGDRAGDQGRRFTGHLTLGRLRRPGRWPAGGAGTLPGPVRWRVGSVALVRSHLRTGAPARYEVLARQPLEVPAKGA
jgi:RNA 2',3'-cyclic 3'-phosphodiesterase